MSRYRIVIEREECDGDKLCCEEAPRTFEMNEEGKAVVINPDGDDLDDIIEAAKQCPMHAIAVYDNETGARVWPQA